MTMLLLPAFFFGLAPRLASGPLRAGRSSASSSPLGSSTTKRYLHFGQSIRLPTRFGSRIGTSASQLGHWTLKLVLAAIRVILRSRLGEVGAD